MPANLRARILTALAARLPANSLRERFARGSFWALVGNVAASGMQLAAFIVVARALGRVRFGELGVIVSTVQTLGALAGLGLGMTATKHLAEWRERDPQRAGRIVGLTFATSVVCSSLVSAALLLAAPWLSRSALAAPHLADELRAAAALLLFSTLMGVQNGVLAGLEAFRTLARVSIVRGALNFPAAIVGAWLAGLSGAVWGLVAGAVVGWLIGQREVRRECAQADLSLSLQNAWHERALLWNFSLPGFLAGVIALAAPWMGTVLLVQGPGGYAEMGLFNAANQWRMALLFLPAVVNQSSLPILASLYGAGNAARFRRMLGGLIALLAGTSLACALPVAVSARWILASYGSGFADGAAVLVLLVLSTVLSNSVGAIGTALASVGRMWTGFALNAFWAVVFLAVATRLVSHGAAGLAWAFLISYALHFVSVSAYVLISGRAEAGFWGPTFAVKAKPAEEIRPC